MHTVAYKCHEQKKHENPVFLTFHKFHRLKITAYTVVYVKVTPDIAAVVLHVITVIVSSKFLLTSEP